MILGTIHIDIEKKDEWHIATSPDLPGFILADRDKDEILADLPEAIQLIYEIRNVRSLH